MNTLKKKMITDYFNDEVDYPQGVFENPLPMNELWCYISSTFVNGFVNYGKPIGAWVGHRYNSPETTVKAHVCDAGKTNWHDIEVSKKELINLLNSGTKTMYHFKLHSFEDDIFLLLKSEYQDDVYLYIWYDCDVSDCCIGKFQTSDSEEDIKQSVVNWLMKESQDKQGLFEENYDNGIQMYDELYPSILKGWLKF